jgi:serine/threonine-protein kinase
MSGMSPEGATARRLSPPDGERFPSLRGYELLDEIASGGMATVYLARKRGVGGFERLVAIKCCHPHLSRDPAFVTMFLDEARLAAKIHHPNVVATLDVGDEEALYFVMQHVEGANLAEWIARLGSQHRTIPPDLLLRVMLDGLAGLDAAHELRDEDQKPLRLVHRDVSPQNILVGLDGVARIVDFGIAKAESRATRTRTGQVKGKTGYMSPEQILGEPLDRRTDVYAAGVVLWEALTGRRLFDAESDAATINLVLSGEIPGPSTLSDAPPALDAIVLRALRFAPEERHPTAASFGQALESSGVQIATQRALGQAVSELFPERALLGRVAAERGGALGLSATPDYAQHSPAQSEYRPLALPPIFAGGVRPRKGRLAWLGLLVVALTAGAVWSVGLRQPPSRAAAAPESEAFPVHAASTSSPSALPSMPAVTSLPLPAASLGSTPKAPYATRVPTAKRRSKAEEPLSRGVARPSIEATFTIAGPGRIPDAPSAAHNPEPTPTHGPAPTAPDTAAPIATRSPTPSARVPATPTRTRSRPSEFRPPDL